MNSRFLEKILEIAGETGGCVKFDLKTYHEHMNVALCGRSNDQTKKNFELAANWIKKRKDPPLVVASTLLVPGYIEREEVFQIAQFVADVDSNIPYSLLSFQGYACYFSTPCRRVQAGRSRRWLAEC
jgi:pyruvate formate lyase activating enzyme